MNVETDFVLDIVCTHDGRGCDAPQRIVSRIYRVAPPTTPAPLGFLEWREAHNPDDPTYPSAMQTWWDAIRTAARNLSPDSGDALLRDPVLQERYLSRGGEQMGSQRWRFRCSDCDDTLLVRHDKLEPILRRLQHHTAPERLFLRDLRTILAM